MSELARFALRFVEQNDTGYAFVPAARRGLRMALDDLFRAKVDIRREVTALLELGAMFERRHGAPGIARSIVKWIARDARVLRALGIRTQRELARVRRSLLKVRGGAQVVAAPRYDAPLPTGTVKLSAFLDPGRERPRQAVKALSAAPRPTPSRRRPPRGVVLA
ncbi:MAG: hypothetical protein RMA76_28775 [Deltaproteobacteria bacterium]|jgi:hypothetical protein